MIPDHGIHVQRCAIQISPDRENGEGLCRVDPYTIMEDRHIPLHGPIDVCHNNIKFSLSCHRAYALVSYKCHEYIDIMASPGLEPKTL